MALSTISELFDLTGKGAIVTGGGRGIGQAASFRLAEAGAAVMVADIDTDSAGKTSEQIVARGGKALHIRADAKSTADAERVVDYTIEAFGSIDILVNNAGIFPYAPCLEVTEDIWNDVIDINLKGLFFYSQAAARAMDRAGKGGKIINLASIDSIKPTGMLVHYDASKGGVLMITKAMAKELAPMKILVNAVAPGSIATPGVKDGMAAFGKVLGMTPEQIDAGFLQRVPLGRMGEPDDIAKVILFFASAAADYITGEVIVIDGGYLLT